MVLGGAVRNEREGQASLELYSDNESRLLMPKKLER